MTFFQRNGIVGVVMSKQNDFHEYLMSDVFNRIPRITAKRMFGGFGYYLDGVIFAILAKEQLYFKVGKSNQKEFEKLGSQPFTYPMKNGKKTTLSYWELPADILEDPDRLPQWIEKSVEESKKSKKK